MAAWDGIGDLEACWSLGNGRINSSDQAVDLTESGPEKMGSEGAFISAMKYIAQSNQNCRHSLREIQASM